MDEEDPNYNFVEQAMATASKIASCESSEQLRRAACMWALKQAVQEFPDALVSHHRFFVDAIDVEDISVDKDNSFSIAAAKASSSSLFATLLLFSDCLLIIRRPKQNVNGRCSAGLDDIESLVRLMNSHTSGTTPTASPIKTKSKLKKGSLTFRGMVMLDEFTADDLGPDGFALHFQQTPLTTSERWADRPLRHYVITPTVEAKSTPKAEKIRFLDHLWQMQLQYTGQSNAAASPEPILLRTEYSSLIEASRAIPHPTAQSIASSLYFSVYQRQDYDALAAKKRHVIHFDLSGDSERIDFLDEGNPHAISRITPCLNDKYVASTEYRISASSTSIPNGVILPVALMRVIESLMDVGLFGVPPRIPGYQASPQKPIIPVRVRSPSLLSRTGTISSMFSNSTTGSPHKRSGTVRSAVSAISSVAESRASSILSHGKASTSATSVDIHEDSSSPVIVPRQTSHEEFNGDVSRIYPISPRSFVTGPHQNLSRDESAGSLQHSRQMPSYGSISQILEDETEAPADESFMTAASMPKTRSMDQIRGK